MKKLLLILHTLKYLRPIQIRYQLWYRLRRIWRKAIRFKYTLSIQKETYPLQFTPWIEKPVLFSASSFTFLNISQGYEKNKINWNEPAHGKLWSYNLNYFDFLLQPEMGTETGLLLIIQFIETLPTNPTAIEPYPIALRNINWIKFLSGNEANTNTITSQDFARSDKGATKQPNDLSTINASLYAQYQILLNNLEYHLLGNHLLEDGFSLLFGAFYFKDKQLYKKASQIITSELEEQILDDGAHFELSPMYHQIILDRLLDCINLVQNNEVFETQNSLLKQMQDKASLMLNWLNNITFSNGKIPLLNDSADGIAPTTVQLKKYASSLNLQPVTLSEVEGRNPQISSSGYRRYNGTNYECILDIGQIGPSYQPGHAHADTFNFVLNVNNKPFIVDTGISTYESNSNRLSERGTTAHNTVTVSEENSSQVWSAFRVAQRANVEILKDEKTLMYARHNGYRKLETTHNRRWVFDDNKIEIEDTLIGKFVEGKAHFWFSPKVTPIQKENKIIFDDATILFKNASSIEIIKTKIPKGYNQMINNYKIEISFSKQLMTKLQTI